MGQEQPFPLLDCAAFFSFKLAVEKGNGEEANTYV